MSAVVIVVGCPRSGTTFMRRCFEAQGGVTAIKLAEANPLHPAQSNDGLITIARMFAEVSLLFVRTQRHPMEIARSFVAIRAIDPTCPRARDDDATVWQWIRDESRSWAMQKPILEEFCRDRDHAIVGARYEDMADEGYRRGLSDKIAEHVPSLDASSLRKHFGQFGTHPANAGRLSAGEKVEPTDEQLRTFRRYLRLAVMREGYK